MSESSPPSSPLSSPPNSPILPPVPPKEPLDYPIPAESELPIIPQHDQDDAATVPTEPEQPAIPSPTDVTSDEPIPGPSSEDQAETLVDTIETDTEDSEAPSEEPSLPATPSPATDVTREERDTGAITTPSSEGQAGLLKLTRPPPASAARAILNRRDEQLRRRGADRPRSGAGPWYVSSPLRYPIETNTQDPEARSEEASQPAKPSPTTNITRAARIPSPARPVIIILSPIPDDVPGDSMAWRPFTSEMLAAILLFRLPDKFRETVENLSWAGKEAWKGAMFYFRDALRTHFSHDPGRAAATEHYAIKAAVARALATAQEVAARRRVKFEHPNPPFTISQAYLGREPKVMIPTVTIQAYLAAEEVFVRALEPVDATVDFRLEARAAGAMAAENGARTHALYHAFLESIKEERLAQGVPIGDWPTPAAKQIAGLRVTIFLKSIESTTPSSASTSPDHTPDPDVMAAPGPSTHSQQQSQGLGTVTDPALLKRTREQSAEEEDEEPQEKRPKKLNLQELRPRWQ
ncbi:hypothetical protein QBC35DRAFT_465048 [Podospora australis]|uniref:Uncharacterized protein n=1 Tax=Podospora australis TaxID=1536484 RepID=A0AAN6WQ78_9PEZI|nr:hypothetical protein QBC35DRAFT_465048 [Podospora australis]